MTIQGSPHLTPQLVDAGLAPSIEPSCADNSGKGGAAGGAHEGKTLSGIRFWHDEQGEASMEHAQEGGRSEGL